MSAPHLHHLTQLIGNDSHAATFQSLGQYRSALLKEIASIQHEQPVGGEQNPERWFAACGDHRDKLIAVHGERSGHIASGIPESQAHDLIKAHNAGVPESAHRAQQGERP